MADAKFSKGSLALYTGRIFGPEAIMDVEGMLVIILSVHDGPDYEEPLYGIAWGTQGEAGRATVREGTLREAQKKIGS